MKPIMTIVVPTFNRSKICKEQIEKLANWRKNAGYTQNVEIFILDNGSDENERRLVENISKENNVIYKYNYANVGFNGNFCRAIQAGDGEYLWVVSDDDYVSNDCLNLVMEYLKSKQKPDLIGFSIELKRNIVAGYAKQVITEILNTNMLGITSLTLVTSTIFRRKYFNYELFWRYEPFWFPHSLSIYITAIERNSECVLIKAKRQLIQESGNTMKERQRNSLTPYVIGLNKQFQTAILHFINRLAESCGQKKIVDKDYIDEVCKRYKCKPDSIKEGMEKITSF